tara:strand:- start:1020 stop:3473 length:2454 start_codon:yes stop_codon:yes gene_type:complete
MRVSLQWLQELVPFRSEPEVLAERLSMAGFEVEDDEDLAARAHGVVVGKVLRKEPHPDATKLNVCSVGIGGDEPLQIVCGAANVCEGMDVAVATVGSHLPAVDLTIKPAKLRGVESSGMLCSLSELGLETSSEGLVDLAVVAQSAGCELPPLGSPVGPLLGLTDRIFELAITANRPDGLSMLGIAREVAALEQISPQEPAVQALPQGEPLTDAGLLEHSELFSLTALSDVTVGPSPQWLRQRLEAAGQRSVNNVVDITNLVMLETGQPLHAYDRDQLSTDSAAAFSLRAAKDGEAVVLLDGDERTLSAQNLVVTNADQPVALAGVMGGQAASVNDTTTRVLLEAAVFPAPPIRRSSRAAGLRSESSARFERGVPSALTLRAADRAVALLQELCGARFEQRACAGSPAATPAPVVLRRSALDRLLGPLTNGDKEPLFMDDEAVVEILQRLGCSVEACLDEEGEVDTWEVVVPPSRSHDLLREVDLIEEVGRLTGFDRFCSHLPDPVEPGGLNLPQLLERRLRSALRSAGLQELSHLSLVPRNGDDAAEQVAISNPLLADYGHLRTSLREGLLQAATRNLQASQPGFWGFELGKVFRQTSEGYSEETRLCGLMAAQRRSEVWSSSGQPRLLSYHEGRGLLEQAMAELGLSLQDRRLSTEADLHPGRAAALVLEGKVVGSFGELHPLVAEANDLPPGCLLFDLALAPILTAASRPNRSCPAFKPYATVPASERDLAFVVDETQEAGKVLQAIRKAGGNLLERVELLDRYTGAPIASGQCSLAVRLRFRDAKATLRDEQVDPLMQKVRAALEKQFKAELRV